MMLPMGKSKGNEGKGTRIRGGLELGLGLPMGLRVRVRVTKGVLVVHLRTAPHRTTPLFFFGIAPTDILHLSAATYIWLIMALIIIGEGA